MLARVQPGLLSIFRSTFHSSLKSTSAVSEHQPLSHIAASSSLESRDSPDNSSVLENPSEEYISVLRGTFVPQPSTQDLIQAKLPPKLPLPTPDDASVFEDTCDPDYASISARRDYNPRSLLQTFRELIASKKYDEAYNLMLEIRSAGIDIPPSYRFELPAQAALSNPSPNHSSLESRTSRFLSWFQLLPSNNSAGTRRFRRSRMLVFRTSQTNLPLAIQFSTLLASKGYYALIIKDAIPFILTYAPPTISLQFIKDFEEAAIGHRIERSNIRRRTRRVKTLVRGPAIIALARANHIREAVSLLPNRNNPDFRLPVGTYKYLYFCLYGIQESESLSELARIKQLLHDPTTSSPYGNELAKNNSVLCLGDEVINGLGYAGVKALETEALMEEIHPESDRYIGEPLAGELSDLITAVQSPILPPIVRLTSFIRDYMNTGRSSAIVHLRRLAFNSDTLCGSWFVQAEMTHYLSEDLLIPVLLSFTNHYFFSGVPKDEILDRLSRFAEARANNDIRHDHPAYAVTRIRSTRRISPHHSHMSLVWQALIKLTPSDEGIEELYRLFIHLASLNADKTSTDLSFLRSPYLRNAIVGPVIFTPFIERLLASKRPERFPDVVRDMMKLNVIPTIHHFTQIGRFYANKGDADRTFKVMDALERQYPVALPVPMSNPRSSGWNKGEELPHPDVTFYANIIRGFVKSKQLTAALKVVRQFKQRYIYLRGQHQLLDDAFDDLQSLMPKAQKPIRAVGRQRLEERFK